MKRTTRQIWSWLLVFAMVLSLLPVSALAADPAEGTTIYVDAAATVEGADGSREHPFATIQDAIVYLNSNKDTATTVEIAGGEYDVSAGVAGPNTYYVQSGFCLDEGFTAAITFKAADPANKPVIYGFSTDAGAGIATGTYNGQSIGTNGQNTVTIHANNVTLENLIILPLSGITDRNQYTTQKALEITGDGCKVLNCEFKPNDKAYAGENGNAGTGSMAQSAGLVYFETSDAVVTGNQFGTGAVVAAGWNYVVDASGNYWGENGEADILAKVDGAVNVENYQATPGAAETTATSFGGIVVTTVQGLTDAIAAAEAGDTIYLAEGTYALSEGNSAYTISKPVNLTGAGADKTVLQGQIQYTATATASEGDSITVSNLKFMPAEGGSNHQGLCWNNNGTLDGYILNVENCVFDGWKYAIGVNSGAKNCTLNVTDSTFTNVWCGMNVSETTGYDNQLGKVALTDDSSVVYEVQVYQLGGSEDSRYNGYYVSAEDCAADTDRSHPDYDGNNADDGNVPDTWPAPVRIGNYYYGSLQEAVNAAGTNKVTITLVSDIVLTDAVQVPAGANLTIEGGNHSISFAAYAPKTAFTSTDDNNREGLLAGTKLTVNNVKFVNTSAENAKAGYAVLIGFDSNGTAVSLNGCTFSNLYAAVYANPVTQADVSYDLAISGCTYENTTYGYSIDETTVGAVIGGAEVTFENNEGTFTTQEFFSNTIMLTHEDKTTVYASWDEAYEAAVDGDTITFGPGEYSGVLFIGDKSLTIKAQYPAYENGEITNEALQSKFTGTFNTFTGKTDGTYNDKTVKIEGFAFSGDGLKVGNTNYNGLGNLEVRNCTMMCGNNLAKENVQSYNQYNYFVKVSNAAGAPYASVIVEDNYISGTPAEGTFAIHPIQLWDVSSATVRNNVIDLSGAEESQAINISAIAPDAEIAVTDNAISGTGGGIYITTWKLEEETSGTIEVSGNVMDNVGSETFDPIFLGAEADEDYSNLGGTIVEMNNFNDGKPVSAVIGTVKDTESKMITATFKDGSDIIAKISKAPAEGEDSITIEAPDCEKAGYALDGWKSGSKTYKPGDSIELSKDAEFTAVWSKAPVFTDVPENAWYYDAVHFAYANGLLVGTGNGKFSPEVPMTRAMMAKLLYNMEGKPAVKGENKFSDVPDNWATDAITWASEAGIVYGYTDGTFRPDQSITRQEMARMLYGYAKYLGMDVEADADLSIFTDADSISAWALDAVTWAVANDVLFGMSDGTFAPNGTATRAQVAQMMRAFLVG